MGCVALVPFFLGGCSSNGQGDADPPPPLVEQSYEENCSFCHASGRVVDVAAAHEAESTHLGGEITDVAIAGGQVTASFKLFNTENPLVPVAGVSANDIRFSVAKLIPGTITAWQSYINTTETKAPVAPGPAPEGNIRTQATAERASTRGGVFTDNGDGSYTYQFSFDITAVTTPIPVAYESALTHRVAMQVTENVTNAIFDFVPDGGPVGETRDIVMNASCNECHIKLGLHGGDRIAVEYCVTCHNPGSADANSDNTVDFKVMVHKIHRGEDLPSVRAGGEYAIWGFQNSKNDYSEVVYPQDMRNCTKCHDGSDTGTPDGDNWKTHPSIDACGSCHDDTSFTDPPPGGKTLHTGGPQADNSRCALCHPADTGGAIAVAKAHEIPADVAAERFQYKILGIEETAPGQFPRVTFSVTDPTRGDAAYDIQSDPEFTAPAGASRLAVLIGWETTEHNNRGSKSDPAQPVSIDPLASGAAEPNPDGSFTVVSPVAVPANAMGSGVVGIEGHPAVPSDPEDDPDVFDLRVPVRSVVQFFAITDTAPVSRRQAVDIDKCNACHGSLSLHGGNRNNEINVCVICHNPNATDVNRRPDNASATLDGKPEETIDFKYMIHAIHGAEMREEGIVVYGFGGSANDFSHVLLPAGEANLLNCQGCHVAGSYELPIDPEVLPTTTQTGNDITDPDDDTNTTPNASICSSCHDDITTKTHMTEEGGSFNFIRFKPEAPADTGGPSGTQPPGHTNRTDCATCHG